MIFDFLTPTRGRCQKCSVARSIQVSNSHTKFSLLSSNGLGGDSITDGTGGSDYDIPFTFLKKMRGDMRNVPKVLFFTS